jgi:AcrR family transcriptional regulator
MNLRAQQKLKTRQAILMAAIELSETKGFSGLSLREVTRKAGIAPATFYRHFTDMEALGLAVVEEVGQVLRQLLRQARQRVRQTGSLVRTSVETFFEFLEQNPHLFRLLSGDRAGGLHSFRVALRLTKQRFIDELVEDLTSDRARIGQPLAYIPELADMIVNQVFYGGLEALDHSLSERKQFAEKLIVQIYLALQGSKALWQEGRGQNQASKDSLPG